MNDQNDAARHGSQAKLVIVEQSGAKQEIPQPSATLGSNQIWDITPGAPVTLDAVTGFATTTGYDMTTGFGSPAGQGFIDQVVAQ